MSASVIATPPLVNSVVLVNLARADFALRNLEEAASHIRRGLEISEKTGDRYHVATTMMNLALVEEARRDFRGALALLERSASGAHDSVRKQADALRDVCDVNFLLAKGYRTYLEEPRVELVIAGAVVVDIGGRLAQVQAEGQL